MWNACNYIVYKCNFLATLSQAFQTTVFVVEGERGTDVADTLHYIFLLMPSYGLALCTLIHQVLVHGLSVQNLVQ